MGPSSAQSARRGHSRQWLLPRSDLNWLRCPQVIGDGRTKDSKPFKLISEISTLSCNDLQRPRMPTVLFYVLWLMFVSGFESHSLRHTVLTAEKLSRLLPRNVENMPVIRYISSARRTGESGLPGVEWRQFTCLSLDRHSQSGFK